MKRMPQMSSNNISVEPKVRNLRTSVPSAVKRTVAGEPQIARMKRMAQMKSNSISVEPKVRNLRTSAFIRVICGKRKGCGKEVLFRGLYPAQGRWRTSLYGAKR
jgi:hypothetical protein